MNKKHLIVFDIDGTLTDSVKIHQAAFIESLLEIGVENIDTNFKTYKHHTDSYIAKVIYENDRNKLFSDSKILEFERLLNDKISTSKINEILGAKALISFIENETDFGICFATGSLLKPAEYKLKSIGIHSPENLLVASNHIFEREKIVQKTIKNASRFYNVNQFERIISIGDGLWDLKTAQNLNLEFIGIGLANKAILLQNGMTNYFDDFTEFKIP